MSGLPNLVGGVGGGCWSGLVVEGVHEDRRVEQAERVLVGSDQERQGQRGGEAEPAELAGRSLGVEELPPVDGTLEVAVERAPSRHEHTFA